jgi:AGZA family xanthine/uracil permease-like MFS transporter
VARIDFADLTEVAPAFATITMMLFTYNIANGLTAGLILYPVVKLAAGRYRELNAGSIVSRLLCLRPAALTESDHRLPRLSRCA